MEWAAVSMVENELNSKKVMECIIKNVNWFNCTSQTTEEAPPAHEG